MNIHLKQLEFNDLELILAWRLNPDVHRYFKTSSKKITWEEHIDWYNSRKNRIDWIVIYENRKVGLVNINNLDSATPEIGIRIGETSLWGKGVGAESIKLAIEWLVVGGYKEACATVSKKNTYSKNLWNKLGFKEEDLDEEFSIYKKRIG